MRTKSHRSKLTDELYNARWIERIKRRTTVSEGGCWLWRGFINPTWGYAFTSYRSRQVGVHRKMYELTHGVSLAREQYVCHTCDVRHCCNPDHLWLGTNSENQKDASRKGRHAEIKVTHCPHGHEYTPENTRHHEVRPGTISRTCKTCEEIRHKSPSYVAWRRKYQKQRRDKIKALRDYIHGRTSTPPEGYSNDR